jgi:hypothetical protein
VVVLSVSWLQQPRLYSFVDGRAFVVGVMAMTSEHVFAAVPTLICLSVGGHVLASSRRQEQILLYWLFSLFLEASSDLALAAPSLWAWYYHVCLSKRTCAVHLQDETKKRKDEPFESQQYILKVAIRVGKNLHVGHSHLPCGTLVRGGSRQNI